MSTFIISLGWRGFGMSGGLIPEIRLGIVHFGWCRGSIVAIVNRQQALFEQACRDVFTSKMGAR